jgi:DUF1009 family protein
VAQTTENDAQAASSAQPLRRAAKTLPEGTRVGLLAGYGRFPFLFQDFAIARGLKIVTIGFKGEADPDLAAKSEVMHWCSIARMGSMVRLCKREKLEHVVMAGKIHKVRMYDPLRWFRLVPDLTTLKLYFGRSESNSDDNMLAKVATLLADAGITLETAAELTPELLAPEGVLTARQPTELERRNVDFGWALAKRMGDLDVGQTVAVHDEAVLAVEAIEGTDQAIRRAGEVCSGRPFTVVKVAKPEQDMRWDVPTVGPDTMRSFKASGARCLGIEADKTYILDPDETLAMADELGVTIISRHDDASLRDPNA